MTGRLTAQGLSLAGKARALSAVSPLNTLNRGYAVLLKQEDEQHQPVTSVAQAAPGTRLTAALSDGALDVKVTGRSAETPFPTLDAALTENESTGKPPS